MPPGILGLVWMIGLAVISRRTLLPTAARA
jgi:hypothetical protein